ncbi:IS110 family RNA-guided transposase [Litchfieldia alkalitelluris]|uniref:IS110 family transposase n=2 Tax=Litchfieldia alkalitelluris TaxID=304268 RepID=UPI00099848DB|nr:IS110 family transposase [Litchfieldia alkalitelluris]
MQIISKYVCGMDVHKKSITACILTPKSKEVRTFGTMTDDLLLLVDWIQSNKCTHVAMESTGVYWKPIYNLLELEPSLQTYVVNAQHIKQVPGRKTDVKDAEWIADLLKHGLLKPSFIPDREQRELRELVRYRRSLIDERAREANRIQKVLEGANIKLSSVATDILGVSGRLMLRQLIKGETNPSLLAELAKKQLRKKMDLLERSLKGLIGPHQKFLLKGQLDHIEYLEKQIEMLDLEIKERLKEYKDEIELLDSIPGIAIQTAQHIIAEIGPDLSRFPSAAHLAAWAGMAPGQNESAGKKKTARTRDGNKYLRSALIESASSATRKKDCYLAAKYQRLKRRRGTNKAKVAIAHQILVIAYHLLTRKESYKELGSNYYSEKALEVKKKKAIKHLTNLGYEIRHPLQSA